MTAVVLPPARPRCALCDRGHSRRRGLCWSCHRKLRACAIPLPPETPRGGPYPPADPRGALVQMLRRLTRDARERLRIALAEVDAA